VLFQTNDIPASKPPPTPRATPAPKTTMKRKGDVIDLEEYEARPEKKPFVAVVKTPAQKEEDALYHISVTVNSKLHKFPSALREKLQKAYQAACYARMFALQAGIIPTYRDTYSIIEGERIRSESFTFKTTELASNILDLSMANIKLLEIFANRKGWPLEKRTFVELKTQSDLENPEFVELHSVRHGELGWGFDAAGCLSLYATGIVGSKLKERVWFVGGCKVKVEEP